MYLLGSVHHGERAEVAAGEGHEYAARDVGVVVGDDGRHVTVLRAVITEQEERNEQDTENDGNPHPTRSRLK